MNKFITWIAYIIAFIGMVLLSAIMIIIIIILILLATSTLIYAEPSYPLWYVSDQLPGYLTDCKEVCTTIPYIDPHIRYYTIWSNKNVITFTQFHFKHVLLSDITLIYGDPNVQLGDNAYWYNLPNFSPITINIHAVLAGDLVIELEYWS